MHAELVFRARGGDREAFASLAAGSVDRLYAIARLILRDADLAEDATQEALLSAWRHLPTLRDVERFDAWLYRLAVNACAKAGRHRRRWQGDVTELFMEPSEPDRASEVADRDQLERGLSRLSEAQRTILVLHFYVDLSVGDIAGVLGVPLGTAKFDPATDWMLMQGPGVDAGTLWFASTHIPAALGAAGWLQAYADGTDPTCWPLVTDMPTVLIGGTTGHYHGGSSCGFLDAVTTLGGRGYTFATGDTNDLGLLKTLLSTVVLDPASADDTSVATPAPSVTPQSSTPSVTLQSSMPAPS